MFSGDHALQGIFGIFPDVPAPMEILSDGMGGCLSFRWDGHLSEPSGRPALAALVSCYLRTTWSLRPVLQMPPARFPPR